MESIELLERVKTRIGKPAATLIAVDDDSQRHFISEMTLSAVALYLLSKYIDGFAEGLGVKELGKAHAQLALLTLDSAANYVSSKTGELRRLLSDISQSLLPHRNNREAKDKAEESAAQTLNQRGVPDFEARDIAAGISDAIFKD